MSVEKGQKNVVDDIKNGTKKSIYVEHKIREDGIFIPAIQGKPSRVRIWLELIMTNPPTNSIFKTLKEIIKGVRNRCI